MMMIKLLLMLIFVGVFFVSSTAEAGPFDKFKKKLKKKTDSSGSPSH